LRWGKIKINISIIPPTIPPSIQGKIGNKTPTNIDLQQFDFVQQTTPSTSTPSQPQGGPSLEELMK